MTRLFFLLFFLPSVSFSSDSTVRGPKYAKMVRQFYELAAKHPEMISIKEYGKSVEGRPLVAVKVGRDTSEASQRPVLLATGATHGYEYLNIADQIPGWLVSAESHMEEFFAKGGLFYIVPIFNPDGYTNITRWNKNKIDLNRDFDVLPTKEKKFTQIETKSFAEFLDRELKDQNAKLNFAVSYHCCGRGDTGDGWGDIAQIGYPWAYTRQSLPETELAKFKDISIEIENNFDNNRIEVSSWADILYEAHGVATDYYYAKYGTFSFVFEGMQITESGRIENHYRMWQSFAKRSLNSFQ